MSYEQAFKRAKSINPTTFLSIERLPHGLGFIASYSGDQSLRSFDQSIITHADGRLGLVIDRHGFIPREAEARDLLYRAGMFPAGAPDLGDEPALTPREEAAVRMEGVLRLHYPDLDDPANLLSAALCDLRHFADRHGVDFGAEDHTGFFKYIDEMPTPQPAADNATVTTAPKEKAPFGFL